VLGQKRDRPLIRLGRKLGNVRSPAPLALAKDVAATYVHGSLRETSDPGNQDAAITARTDADDGRANALVRRYSALGLTEPLI